MKDRLREIRSGLTFGVERMKAAHKTYSNPDDDWRYLSNFSGAPYQLLSVTFIKAFPVTRRTKKKTTTTCIYINTHLLFVWFIGHSHQIQKHNQESASHSWRLTVYDRQISFLYLFLNSFLPFSNISGKHTQTAQQGTVVV